MRGQTHNEEAQGAASGMYSARELTNTL
jgi:hypothetical protein